MPSSVPPTVPDRLAAHTTLRLGGPATAGSGPPPRRSSSRRRTADAAGEPVLVLGGGSNLVVADDGSGDRGRGRDAGSAPDVDATDGPPAAACWSRSRPVRAGTTSSPLAVQRVGRASKRCPASRFGRRDADPERGRLRPGGQPDRRLGAVWDRTLRGVRTFANADCGFGHRTRFKADPASRSLSVTFQLRQAGVAGCPGGLRRARPRARRRGRATRPWRPRCAGRCSACAAAKAWCSTPTTTTRGAPARSSPTVPARRRGAGRLCPAWPADGTVKTSAAWLIDHAGSPKGQWHRPGGALSGKHAGALQPRRRHGGLLALAREVRDGVEARFGIRTGQRAVLVGCSL